MPAPTVWLVMRSIRMKPPVVRFRRVGVEGQRLAGRDVDDRDLVQFQLLGCELLEAVGVDPVLDLCHAGEDGLAAAFQQQGPAGQQRLLMHPDQMRSELVGDLGPAHGAAQQIPAGDVDLVIEQERYSLPA